jgi:hypothetical protein
MITHTLTNSREYFIESWQFESTDSIIKGDVAVYLEGTKLKNNEFSWNSAEGKVRLLNVDFGKPGDKLEIYILKDAEYTFIDTEVVIENATNLTDNFVPGDQIEFELPDSTTLNGTIRSYTKDGDTVTIILQGLVSELAKYYGEDELIEIQGDDSTPATVGSIEFIDVETLNMKNRPLEDVKIYVFSNHDVNDFERKSYDVVYTSAYAPDGSDEAVQKGNILNGYIKLDTPAISSNYVWAILNGELLTPDSEYKVVANGSAVQVSVDLQENDNIQVLHFAGPKVSQKFAFRIFKDMLNRTNYKRLREQSAYVLAQDLKYYDNSIVLVDSTDIDIPNPAKGVPGVIFIEGERIEYYQVQGTVLRQIRRSTLGTGTKLIYPTGTKLYNQGPSESVPYQDKTYVYNPINLVSTGYKTNGGDKVVLDFNPSSVNEFDIFVGGKRLNKTEKTIYQQEERLNGEVITDIIAQDSPEGDIVLPPEFSLNNETFEIAAVIGSEILRIETVLPHSFVDGEKVVIGNLPSQFNVLNSKEYEVKRIDEITFELYESYVNNIPAPQYGLDDSARTPVSSGVAMSNANVVKLTTTPPSGLKVQVVRKLGKIWSETEKTLEDSNTQVANFLRGGTIKLPR